MGSSRAVIQEDKHMFIIHEDDEEYRFGNSGPKYLMKGPRMNFAIVQFQPGEDFNAHYHNEMEENFFILEGELDIVCRRKEVSSRSRRTHPYRARGDSLRYEQRDSTCQNDLNTGPVQTGGQGGGGVLYMEGGVRKLLLSPHMR